MNFDPIKDYARTIINKKSQTMHQRAIEIMSLVTDAVEGKIDNVSIKSESGANNTRVKITVTFPEQIIDSIRDCFWITGGTHSFLVALDEERPEWLQEVIFNGDYYSFTMIVKP